MNRTPRSHKVGPRAPRPKGWIMPDTQSASAGTKLTYNTVVPSTSIAPASLPTVAEYLLWLMFRNVASDGFVFVDPIRAGRDGSDLWRRCRHRHDAAVNRRPAAQSVGRRGIHLLLPDQRRRPAAQDRTDAGPLSRGRVRRRRRSVRGRSSLGHLHVQLRRALLPARGRDHAPPTRSRSMRTQPNSSTRWESHRRRRRLRPPRRSKRAATRCCKRSCFTAIGLSSASSSTPTPAMRRA